MTDDSIETVDTYASMAANQRARIRVKATTRMLSSGVPDDARPGDYVVGNRGAMARVIQPPSQFGGLCGCIVLEYCGNYHDRVPMVAAANRLYDFR